MKFGKLVARLIIGGFFFGHGAQKWFGWFDGPGLDGATGFMESIEMKPGRANAHLASGSETIGGAAIALGALTPLAATTLIATMITAARKVHLANGPWASNNGYELNLVMIAGLLAIVEGGPGDFSIDAKLGLDTTGGGYALASLAAGAIGSTLAIEAGKRASQSESS
jgi:putative oxidoreductase